MVVRIVVRLLAASVRGLAELRRGKEAEGIEDEEEDDDDAAQSGPFFAHHPPHHPHLTSSHYRAFPPVPP